MTFSGSAPLPFPGSKPKGGGGFCPTIRALSYIYIYTCILYICKDNCLLCSKIELFKEVNYLFGKCDNFRSKIRCSSRKLIICFEYIIVFVWEYDFPEESELLASKIWVSFENMSLSEKMNYLLRKYDLLARNFDLFEEYSLASFENMILLIKNMSSWYEANKYSK